MLLSHKKMQVCMCPRKVLTHHTRYGSGNLVMTQPLFLRLLEHAREDKLRDIDLHNITEIAARQRKKPLHIDDYDELTASSEEKD